MLENSSPPTMAMVIRPAWVGLMPRAIWKYCDKKTGDPNIATPTMIEANVARLVVRSRKSRIGMIGSFTESSVTTAATSSATPRPTIQAVVPDAQPKCEPARDTQISSTETPPAMSAAPR